MALTKVDISMLEDITAGTKVVAVAPSSSGNVLTSDGTNWTSASAGGGGGGKVLQVVQYNHKHREQITSTSKVVINTAWAATITPSATTSRIKVEVKFDYSLYGSYGYMMFMTVLRNSTDINTWSYNASYPLGLWCGTIFRGAGNTSGDGSNGWQSSSFTHIDSPNSTSALTYRPYMKWEGAGCTFNLGPVNNTTDNHNVIILTEIGV